MSMEAAPFLSSERLGASPMERIYDFVLKENGKVTNPTKEENLEWKAYRSYLELNPRNQLILLEEWWGYQECPRCEPSWNHWNYDSIYNDRPTMWVVHSCHIDLVNLCNKWHREYFCQCGYTTCSKHEVPEHPLFPYNKQYMKEQYYYNFGHWQFLTPTKEQIEEMKSVFLMWKVHEYCQRWTMV